MTSIESLERDKKVPKRFFTVVDKTKYNQCNKESSCQEVYNLYLKTDNGFSFKEPFDYNRYLETGGKPFPDGE